MFCFNFKLIQTLYTTLKANSIPGLPETGQLCWEKGRKAAENQNKKRVAYTWSWPEESYICTGTLNWGTSQSSYQLDPGTWVKVFSFVNLGRGMLHLARHSVSNEGLTCWGELTLSTMAWRVASSSPKVALKADNGKLKNASETVKVPGSRVGKLAMNCAGVHWKFCPKCTSPAASTWFA